MAERRESGLLSQLGRAQQKISTLEEFLRDRERQFHSAVSRLQTERRHSRGFRPRRVGRGNDALLRMHTLSQSREEPEDDPDIFSKPLDEYVCLRLTRIIESGEEDDPVPFVLRRLVSRQYDIGPEGAIIGSASDCSICLPKEAGVLPQHLEIKWVPVTANITPQGGSDFPGGWRESRLRRQSAVEGCGSFHLEDLTGGEAAFSLAHDSPNLHQVAILEQGDTEEGGGATGEGGGATEESRGTFSILSPRSSVETQINQSNEGTGVENTSQCSVAIILDNEDSTDQSEYGIQAQIAQSDEPSPSRLALTHGVKFLTGRVEWALTALPQDRVLTLKMFSAAQRGNLDELRAILDSSSCANLTVPYVFVSSDDSPSQCPVQPTKFRYSSVSIATEQELDINVEYQPPSYGDDSYYNQVFGRRKSSTHVPHPLSPLSPLSPSPTNPHPPRLLLHIAISNGGVEMVRFLLERGADVNRCSGELQQSALHLAAQLNNLPIVTELLHWGADLELADAQHLHPLALTSSYQIRRLLLSTALLCSAAEAGDSEEVIRLLSSQPLSPNARGLRHKNSLHLACTRGHEDVVQALLLNGANVNAKGGSRQRTPLHYASLNNHVAIATILLQEGANEFARDSGGYTPLNLSMGGEMCKLLHKQPLSLCLAVQSGDLAAVKSILRDSERQWEGDGKAVRAVDQRNEQGHAPLHLAATTANLEIAQVLVSHGAELNLHGGSDSWTPLCYAAMAGHAEIVEFLLSVGADTEECDCHGNSVQERVEQAMDEIKDRKAYLEKRGRSESIVETSLHTLEPASMVRQESAPSSSVEGELVWLQVRYDRLKTVSRLLTSGAERLLKAMESRNLSDFVSLLGSGGVSPDVLVDKHSPTPALIRTCEDGLYHFTEALLEHGANICDSGPQDHMPLLVAAGNGHSDIVQLLLKHGASVNAQSSDGLTSALHEAASTNSLPTVQCLLSAGASVTAQNSAGETPFDCTTLMEIRQLLAFGPSRLLVAASDGDHTSIRQLVEGGVSPSHEFPHGITALHEACEGGHEEAVEVLIALGADVNKQTHVTLATPLHLASYHAHPTVARLLLEAGSRLDIKDSEGKVPFEVASTNELRRILVEARSVKTQPVSYDRQPSSGQRCMICMDNPINTILLPCGHQAFCTSCVSQISSCALDRQPIREVITVFK